MARRLTGIAIGALMLTSCGSVEIEALAGCYEINEQPAFRLRNDYAVFVDGRQIARMRMSETESGARFDSRPGLIAVAGEDGYNVQADGDAPEQAGFIEKTMGGSIYMLIPTGEAEPAEVKAYLVEGGEC